MATKQITAYFRPQADLGHSCIDIDGGYRFDVTEQIKEMGLETALALDANHEDRDDLWRESEEAKTDDHHGPFEVDLDYDAIRAFFA